MILDYVRPEEKELIDYYRSTYGASESTFFTYDSPMCSTDEWLREWASNKQDLFDRVFHGDKLILKDDEPFSFSKSIGQIEYEIESTKGQTLLENFVKAYGEFLYKVLRPGLQKEYGYDIYDYDNMPLSVMGMSKSFKSLIDPKVLAKKVVETSFSIPSWDSHKEIKINSGTKVITALKKINKEYNFVDEEGLQDFINKYSNFFTQQTIKGTLCLSIHPLDYITMSENTYGWDSCMNWYKYIYHDDGTAELNYGCYRRGTVEMMNSPNVIVAYLDADTPMTINGVEWNNKRWRCLFIVEDNCILSVKSYPYYNEELTKKAINMIKEQGKYEFDNDLISYTNNDTPGKSIDVHKKFLQCADGHRINLVTNAMYNDFGRYQPHWCYHNNFEKDYTINYSGPALCCWCGKDLSDETYDFCGDDKESILSCSDCAMEEDEESYCDCCGEVFNEKDGYWVADGHVCEDCFCTEYDYSSYMEEYYRIDDLDYCYVSFEAGSYSSRYNTKIIIPHKYFDNIKTYFKEVYEFNGIKYVKADEVIRNPDLLFEDGWETAKSNHNTVAFC